MGRLRGRLRRLEAHSAVKRCPECGLLPSGLGYVLILEGEEADRHEQEWCSECGRELYFLIEVGPDDEDANPGSAGGGLTWP